MAAISLGLTVAVGAKHAQVFKPVIGFYAVNVVDMRYERFVAPFGDATMATAIMENPRAEETMFNIAAALTRN